MYAAFDQILFFRSDSFEKYFHKNIEKLFDTSYF